MFIGGVYLFRHHNGDCLKRILILSILTFLLSGCGAYLNSENPRPNKIINLNSIKKSIVKGLSFLPYIEYIPSIKPTENGVILLNELDLYESIIDDHLKYGRLANDEIKIQKDGGVINWSINKTIMYFNKLFTRNDKNESLEEKIAHINTIRQITNRYETWSISWNEKTDMVKEKISIDEIDLVKSEIKRISKKL